jgi:hypothetical protein
MAHVCTHLIDSLQPTHDRAPWNVFVNKRDGRPRAYAHNPYICGNVIGVDNRDGHRLADKGSTVIRGLHDEEQGWRCLEVQGPVGYHLVANKGEWGKCGRWGWRNQVVREHIQCVGVHCGKCAQYSAWGQVLLPTPMQLHAHTAMQV